MTAVAAEARQPPLALVQALEQLSGPLDQLDTTAQLQAVEDACTALVALVEGGGRLPTDLLENALEAVARGLAAARQQLEAAASQLAAARQGGWACALLAAADTCMHSDAWHAAWHADAGGGAQAYKRTVELARDMLRQDLLPLLADASAQQDAATGFCLAQQYRALLTMGRTAAEIVGMRDPRHRRPGLRNFSVLNVLWNGIQKLWTCVPQEVRADMERQGLGGAEAAGAVLGFIRRDIRACHTLLDPGVGKLLQYWVQKARAVLGSLPGAAPACWSGALEVPLAAHQELALLAAAAGGGSSNAAALGEALREQLLPRAVQLLVACLSATTAEDKLRVMLDELRMRLGAGEQSSQAVHALRTMLHLLHSSPCMPPLARHHCVALLGSVLDALPGPCAAAALQSAQLREAVADAALAFLATCCHAAATAPSDEALTPCERQLAAQTWERCQQQLFLHALQPHPLTAHVLGCVWADLAAASSEALLKSHISALHDLLHVAAAAGAAAGHGPPSPLYSQLLGLLACLLAAAPAPTQDAFFAHFLQALGKMRDDPCQLACLAADLRLVALVDGASGSAAAAPQVQGVLAALFRWLTEAAPTVMKRAASAGAGGHAAGGMAEAETLLHLAWLLEALHCAAAYFAATGGPQGEEGVRLLKTTASRIAFLLGHAAQRGMHSLAGPCLAVLAVLPPLEAGDLEQLVPALAACQQQPELAAAVTGLAPSLARCPTPHAHVLQALLLQEGPLLQHLGMEAFCRYAQTCPPENVVLAVPPALKDPATGALLDRMVSLLTQYTQRSVTEGSGPAEAEVAGWAAALRQEALGAAGALRRALEVLRAQDPGEPRAASGSPPPGEAGDGVLAAAVQAVAASIQQAEAALQAAPLDPSSALRSLGLLQVRARPLTASLGGLLMASRPNKRQRSVVTCSMIDNSDFERIDAQLRAYDEKRETVIKRSRDIQKLSKQAIFSLHRGAAEEADQRLAAAKKAAEELLPTIKENPPLRQGSYSNAIEEYAEGLAFKVYLNEGRLITQGEVELAEVEEYLGGVLDFTGELGRLAIAQATKRDEAAVQKARDLTEGIMGQFLQFDLRNGSLRKKYDALKYTLKKLENTLYELSLTKAGLVAKPEDEPEPAGGDAAAGGDEA